MPFDFQCLASPLSPNAHARAAALLKCDEAAIRAVSEVEVGPYGPFLPSKRPTILFESHVFGRYKNYIYNKSHPNISSVRWDRRLYGPAGEHQYTRLEAAMNLDRYNALRSASWGAYQLMGFNFKACGYSDVESFVKAMCMGMNEHLMAFSAFIISAKLDDELRNHDWKNFARQYNGPAYAMNGYDKKMEAAYKNHS